MSILAVGSIAYDTIKTPFVQGKNILGGSLTYFALSASYFTKVGLVGIVGSDFRRKDLDLFRKYRINTDGLVKASGKTFRWSGEYSFDLNTRKTLSTELNVFENFNPVLPHEYLNSKYVFLGNIDPDLQLKVLKQIKNPKLVVADTMNYWIEKKPKSLKRMLKLVDILIINDSEVRELAKKSNLVLAAQAVLGNVKSALIIKQGEYGCLMFQKNKWFSLPAFPIENVYDPTGAGDAFAGGFVGYLASQNNFDEKTLKTAAVYGTVLASFAVEKLGPYNLEGLTKAQIKNRASKLREITKF